MPRILIDHLVSQLDTAFDGNDEHSLLGNIRGIDERGWRWKPAGGERTIAGVIWHAGSAKYIYHSHTFGDASGNWEHPLCAPSNVRDMDGALRWIRDAHCRFVDAVAALDDAQLPEPRATHWGAPGTVQFAIETIIQHDFFHAGEVNHIRAMLQGNDRWGYFGQPPPPGDP